MKKKQFKAESKKLLDMMIHSIYTHKEIFLRELISNSSDAIDKLYFRSLTDDSVGLTRGDYQILITVNKEDRTLEIRDNGCGMTQEELESNLGTIARSGSLDFKKDNETGEEIDIIGQFGVGFYSSFMVSSKVEVKSKAFGAEEAYCWTSTGIDGYEIKPCEMEGFGTIITLTIKENTEEEKYDEFLDSYKISSLVKKYSDYISYPIRMEFESRRIKEKPAADINAVELNGEGDEDEEDQVPEYESYTELRTLNSMIPLWRKNKSEITKEEYESFYQEKFYDYTPPARVIHTKVEGQIGYDALLYIPKKPPFGYYTKEFEKGLQLYSSGVMIMDKCADLLPDYFSFVKGLVDSADLSLNISREMLQQDHQLKLIAKNLEKKIKSELEKLLAEDREAYEEFFNGFGVQLKFGVYNSYGMNKDSLKDLLMFYSSSEKKLVTLKEYVSRMKEDQKTIYYAPGETTDKTDMLPQVESVKDKGYEILYLTDPVDEFAIQMLMSYEEKTFANVCADRLDIETDEEKEDLKKENEEAKDLLDYMKEAVGEGVTGVRFTNKLKNHPVCLTSEGVLSVEMEKALNAMPTDERVKAELVLEINADHEIANTLKDLWAQAAGSKDATGEDSKDKIRDYAKILYGQARLIGGLSVENPAELSSLVCKLLV